MKPALLACAAALLAGCASFDTPLERLLAQVNVAANRAAPCTLQSFCQANLPSREELRREAFLDSHSYAMSKAYALQDAGIDAWRMRFARFDLLGRPHTVLVVDEHYVLDSADPAVRRLQDYRRFKPVLAALPPVLMTESGASAGATAPKR